MHSSLRTLAVGVLLASSAACGATRRGSGPAATIVFRNESIEQAEIYAQRPSTTPTRIGVVQAGRTESLRLPSTVIGGLGTVNIIARIFASGRAVSSGNFSIREGDRVEVTLPASLSTLSVLPAGSR